MVDFLLQEGVFESLMHFVTQIGTSLRRPAPSDVRTEELKLGYKYVQYILTRVSLVTSHFRAVILLTPDEPSEALLSILSKKALVITRLVFEIFRDDSAGSFYHAYRILDTLLKCSPADVYEGITSDGRATERIQSMLRYIGYSPVHEMIVVLLALTPLARTSPMYNSCARVRWAFLEQLKDWILMKRIAEVLTRPHDYCFVDSYISPENHSTAAVQLMLDLIEKLSLEDTGEYLLQPLGYDTSILDQLIDTVIDPHCHDNIRRSSCKLICFLLRRAAEQEILCIVNTTAGNPPQQTSIPNRLFPLRERIVLHIETRLNEVFHSVSTIRAQFNDANAPVVKYSGYVVRGPFSSLRASLVELVVLMVESDEAVASTISVDLWRDFMSWTVRYGFNSIYHALFYRLIFAVLR